MATTQLRRDPFARQTLIRESHPAAGNGCHYCGQFPRTLSLYQYAWEADSIYPQRIPLANRRSIQFCSVGCWEAYSG